MKSPAILIVEDERLVAMHLQRTLRELGYDAYAIASSAEEALTCSNTRRPDVVLMDIRINGPEDGIQTAIMLKSKFPVSIIYLTGFADDSMIDRAKRTEPHGFLTKPVRAGDLRSMIEIAAYKREADTAALRKSREKIRDLAQRLESVREEERRKVAVDLHDGIAQDLFAMKLGLDHLEILARRRAGIRNLCKELTAAVATCLEDTRQLTGDLRPVALTHLNLATVIRDHARHFEAHSPLSVKVTEVDRVPKLDEATQRLFFRAAQEGLTNVARHARATAVEIQLRSDGDRFTMEIRDDGTGIEEGAMDKPRSLGLLALRERFVARGGGLTVQRGSPRGTMLTVHLPKAVGAANHAA